MNKTSLERCTLAGTTAAALTFAAAQAGADDAEPGRGRYVTGDFHNHTTCSDGTLSLQKLVDKSVRTFGLDWFVQAGHGGNSARNCTLAEDPFEPVPPALGLTAPPTIPAGGQPADSGAGPNQTWVATLPGGEADIQGDVVLQNNVRSMWKWQMIQEFIYPVIENESRERDKPIFVGLEQVVPGHEHASTAVIDGQLPARGAGDASAMAQFEYCFDRADNDRSRGAGNQWDCEVPGSANNGLIDPAARKIIVTSGTGSGLSGHVKSVEGVKWMEALSPQSSYFVPAHLERAGAFNPNGNNGYDVQHLRDYNNAAPEVAFGFESMPGHQAEGQRGSYSPNAVGGGTYGGTGVYAAAVGGVWDALLGEGRSWWFFASSDYHNRGSFGPDQRETTADFFPGEYTKDYVSVARKHRRGHRNGKYGPPEIVDGLRGGNSYVANGGLIDELAFVACAGHPKPHGGGSFEERLLRAAAEREALDAPGCATMGETLEIEPGEDVVVHVVLRDPRGTNNSPYSFPNPSLLQIGVSQPLNAPVLDHVDLIGADVTGLIDPADTARYAGPLGSPAATNASARVKATFNDSSWKALRGGWRVMSYRLKDVAQNQYVRLRGTNLPPATPFETDSQGNPLLDFGADLQIPCADAACPAHLPLNADGVKTSSFDVAAWADLWFYANPIFISVDGE